jgi:probable HAF family extracellular repeat protein
MENKFLRCAAAAACLLASAAFADKKPQWTITDLGGLSATFGGGSYVEALNNRGEVTGWSYSGESVPMHHGIIWSNGAMIDLGVPEGMSETSMTAINNHGMAVGEGAGAHGQSMVVAWKDGKWIVPGVAGTAYDVNDHGVMAGTYLNGSASRAFIMKEDGVVHDLGTLGGTLSAAFAINDKSTAVGYSYLAGNQQVHAFVFEDAVIKDLGTLGGPHSSAFGINSHGTIVGYAQEASGRTVAMIRDRAGMRALFDLPGNHAARAINDKGAVVGSIDADSFLYQHGVVTRLNSIPEVIAAGWSHLSPHAINDRGWIAGIGLHDGEGRSFVLVPR